MTGSGDVELIWSSAVGPHVLRARGCPAEDVHRLAIIPTELLPFWPVQPTLGRFAAADDGVCFLARFPLSPGTSYSLLRDGVQVVVVTVPARRASPVTSAVAIYPTAHELPLNQLKLYVQFSGPMSEGWVERAVRVHRADTGSALPGVFLPMPPELWDRARQRLTLLLDPGRIKRGLAPHREVGYPLQEGVPIVVSIDRSARDANGLPLAAGAERCYAVGPAIRQHVTPSAWRLHSPVADSLDAFVVGFDRPLDRALLEHSLVVLDAHDRAVDGQATIADGERSWTFRPLHPWRPEVYRLSVEAWLEDLAGNSLTRLFDRDLTRAEDAPIDVNRAVLEFWPRQGR